MCHYVMAFYKKQKQKKIIAKLSPRYEYLHSQQFP